MSLIVEFKVLGIPEYCLAEIRDSNSSLSGAAMIQAARSSVVASNGPRICIHSLQRDIDVQITIRVWGGPQEVPKGAEGHAQVTFQSLTGEIGVDVLTDEVAHMTLPARGSYEGHAAWVHRQATSDYWDECISRSVEEDWSSVRIGQARKECPVLEEYTIDLWHVGDASS